MNDLDNRGNDKVELYVYVLYLECGHAIRLEQTSERPKPHTGRKKICLTCGKQTTVTRWRKGE